MNYLRLTIFLTAFLFFASCETDFDINADWKDITVVYGALNQNDSIHYIRIQKLFLVRAMLCKWLLSLIPIFIREKSV